MRSLRARLVVGTILWTIGLAVGTHYLILALVSITRRGAVVHFAAMTVAAFALLLAGLVQIRAGLAPIFELRARLLAVREGRSQRVEGRYPSEVEPLVGDLNALIADRERSVARAQAKAGDLAHGLKTPLAVLAQEAQRAQARGDAELAATVAQQVERMRRHVDYHLAHARAAASSARLGARCALRESVDGLVRTLQRLHAERRVEIEAQVPEGLAVQVERADLDEMLGNLLDNAFKWTRTRIRVAASPVAGEPAVLIRIDDDGPGLDSSLQDAVLQRGVRADEAAPGWGLGLSIVSDLAELYGGAVVLERSPEGGVSARLRLPAA